MKDWATEIRSEKHKEKIDLTRSEVDQQKDRLKRLSLVLQQAEYVVTADPKEDITNHSGLLQLDFDDVKDMECAAQTLREDPYVLMVCVSPSGSGIKAVTADPSKHKECFSADRLSVRRINCRQLTKDPKRTFLYQVIVIFG